MSIKVSESGRSGKLLQNIRTIHADLSFVFEIAFVRDDNDRERILVFYSKDLLVECTDLLEGIP